MDHHGPLVFYLTLKNEDVQHARGGGHKFIEVACFFGKDSIYTFLLEYLWVLQVKPQRTGPEIIYKNSCSSQLSMKFFLLINVKMPKTVGILTFMSRKTSILGLSGPEKKKKKHDFLYFYTYEHLKFYAQLSLARKKFYIPGDRKSKASRSQRA